MKKRIIPKKISLDEKTDILLDRRPLDFEGVKTPKLTRTEKKLKGNFGKLVGGTALIGAGAGVSVAGPIGLVPGAGVGLIVGSRIGKSFIKARQKQIKMRTRR